MTLDLVPHKFGIWFRIRNYQKETNTTQKNNSSLAFSLGISQARQFQVCLQVWVTETFNTRLFKITFFNDNFTEIIFSKWNQQGPQLNATSEMLRFLKAPHYITIQIV